MLTYRQCDDGFFYVYDNATIQHKHIQITDFEIQKQYIHKFSSKNNCLKYIEILKDDFKYSYLYR